MTYRDEIDLNNLPKHIAIIMDGNGRWAKKRMLPRTYGHSKGSDRVIEIVEASYNLGIKSLSFYAFSTENWKRPQNEINKLMELIVYYVRTQLEKIKNNNIKINVLGDIIPLPELVQDEINSALDETSCNNKMNLNIALNYGGQDEILRACKNIGKDLLDGSINLNDINKNLFENYLYTRGQGPIDLLIRPSGELRVSNFMLWQMSYAEFYFSDILWPDFSKEELYKAIVSFQKRDRRFGGL
ncbi:isoprenyl transferase [Peptoniphilus raoultii]|uniref:isoprenyl transferase n=1 Tax=Peptoniphilus raoultii TaxID=1776387 RepID=UPI0008D948A0|nr:isoprenyl transferase [Peptoniphilus raoultii]